MPTFKDKELEELSQRILNRAALQPQTPSALGRIRQVALRQKLPILRRRFK